jgi:hypothetical protein
VDSEQDDDGQTNSVSFDTICLAVERRFEPVDQGRVDDGQTNFVSFDIGNLSGRGAPFRVR